MDDKEVFEATTGQEPEVLAGQDLPETPEELKGQEPCPEALNEDECCGEPDNCEHAPKPGDQVVIVRSTFQERRAARRREAKAKEAQKDD